MQHDVPPIAVDILQNLGGIPREKTYVARVTNPVSLMPAILVEAPSATFATAGLQLAMTTITQLYWDVVIEKKKKLYVPVCVKAHAYLMGMAIWSALLKWKDDGFISGGYYQHYARRVKVAVYVPAKIAAYTAERDWLHCFNSDPKNNSEDVDVLISTSVIQSGLSLPAEFQYMMAIISRQPKSHRHHTQAISSLRTNSRQFDGQRAIVIVERGVTGGRDVNLYRRGTFTDRTTVRLSADPVDILATLTWFKNAELADTANRTHWLMRQLYGPQRSTVQSMKLERGQSRFVLTDSFLIRLLGSIHERTIKYSKNDMRAYMRSALRLSKRQQADVEHSVFLDFETHEGGDGDGDGDRPDKSPLPDLFPVLRELGNPPVGWIRDALQSLRSDYVDTTDWDMSCLCTATPWHFFNSKALSLSAEKNRDALKLAVIIVLWHRQRNQYPIGRTEQERATLRELGRNAERTWTNAIQQYLPDVGGLFGVMPAANLIADILIELGFVNRENSSLSPAFRYNFGSQRAQGPPSAFRLEPEYEEYRRSNSGDRDNFFRYYLMRGHPCLSNGSEADQERFLAQRKIAIRYLYNMDVNVHTWWRDYVPIKSRRKRTVTQREEGDYTTETGERPVEPEQEEQEPPLDQMIERWGDSTREFMGITGVKALYIDGWAVDTAQYVTSIAYIIARKVCSRYTLECVTSEVFSEACCTAAALVPLTCAIIADDEAAQNGFDVNIIRKRGWNSVLTAPWLAALYKAHHSTPTLHSWCASYTSRNIQDTRDTIGFDANVDSLLKFCGAKKTIARRLGSLKIIDFGTLPSIESLESQIRGEEEDEERTDELHF